MCANVLYPSHCYYIYPIWICSYTSVCCFAFVFSCGLDPVFVQGEPQHITLQIDILNHFRVSAFETLKLNNLRHIQKYGSKETF